MRRIVQIKIILVALSGLWFTTHAMSQDLSGKERKAIATQAIKDLAGGTLILRLKSKHNKITKLEELLATPDIKASTRTKLSEDLESTIDERNRFNRSLTYAFEEYYSFSNIYYIYDTASVSLINGQRSGIFLNEDLELDLTIEIPEGIFFVLKVGTTDSASTTGVEALVMMDRNLKDLAAPFPYYVRVNSIGRLFTRIFNHKKLVKKDSKKIVQKLESNLQRYNTEVRGER
ncbi:MAG: hypothetical protein ACI8P3_001508 [Saprospiraceae bacterium]|jgi:hypothetical protein